MQVCFWKKKIIFPRLLQLLSEPHREKGSCLGAGSPIPSQWHCLQLASALWSGNRSRSRSRAAETGLLTRAQWSTTSSNTRVPPTVGQFTSRFCTLVQRDMGLDNSAPLTLHLLYSITFPFKNTFPSWAFTPPSVTQSCCWPSQKQDFQVVKQIHFKGSWAGVPTCFWEGLQKGGSMQVHSLPVCVQPPEVSWELLT